METQNPLNSCEILILNKATTQETSAQKSTSSCIYYTVSVFSIMIHGCTKQRKPGKPKYLTKTADAQPNPDISTMKNNEILQKAPEQNSECLGNGSSDVLYLQQISKENLEFPSEFSVFSLFGEV